jgi:uncharacterized repeat protein (TIGR02543 family)
MYTFYLGGFVKHYNSIKKTAAIFAVAVMCFAGDVAGQFSYTFSKEDFSAGIPEGWTNSGFSWQSSGGIVGAGLRVNLNSENTTASLTLPGLEGVDIGPNAQLKYSYKATNYSDGSVAGAGVVTHTISVDPRYSAFSSGNYTPPDGDYWIMRWPIGVDNTYRSGVKITITFTWQSGDIYVHLDNIQIIGVRYIIKFDANGGEVSRTLDTTQTEARKLDSLPTPTRDRYAFNGWFTSATGGAPVTASDVFSSSATLYAQWIPIYRVTFDANGGSVSPTSGSTGMGGTLASLPTPARSGYGFNGWFTSATGGTEVTASKVFSADATIYAQWTQNPYTVTFNANGGTVTPASIAARSDGTIASLPTPTRTGYTFDGWFTASTGGTEVTADRVYSANTTIYAQWTLIPVVIVTYTITFDANGGEVATATGTTGTGGKLTSLPTPARTGYTFNGWYTAATGGTKVTTGTVFSENATVYARWTLITNTVTFNANGGTFNANGGSVTPASANVRADGTLASLPTPTRAGYTFNGWFTESTGGAQVTVDRVYSANTTIYAQWTLIRYLITFDPSGGAALVPAAGRTGTGGKLTELPTPAKPGYIFNGWFTAETGGAQVTTSTVFSQDTVIYARWILSENPTETVMFDANGGTVSPTYGIIGANGTLGSLPAPSREGYVFNGWFSAATGGTPVTPNTPFSGSATIYAQWLVVAVAASDRVIPKTDLIEGAVIAPVTALSADFIAGPNLVSGPSGAVSFFRGGSRIESATLYVYDASGNAVKKISVYDDAVGGARSKRLVGSWDLTDKKGRAVSGGVYLARGVIKTAGGKSEKVSLVLGVR